MPFRSLCPYQIAGETCTNSPTPFRCDGRRLSFQIDEHVIICGELIEKVMDYVEQSNTEALDDLLTCNSQALREITSVTIQRLKERQNYGK